MLIDSLPTSAKHPRRTLTLIAKMLQNLANKPSYAKETYMVSLNPFVEQNKARINVFLNSLCEVGDFYETLEVSRMRIRRSDQLISGDPVLTIASMFEIWVVIDGPVYGFIEEGSSDQYYDERNVQYAFSAGSARRRSRKYRL